MKDDNSEDGFTFSIQGKEYVIKDKFQPAKDKSKINFLHGPSIGIGTAITVICVIIVFFSIDVNDDLEQVLIEKQNFREQHHKTTISSFPGHILQEFITNFG